MAINSVHIAGHLGRDADIKAANNGTRYAQLAVAVTEYYKDKSGQKQQKTDWIKVETWNEKIVAFCEDYMKKGTPIYVMGKLKTNKWETNDGQKRSETIVNVDFGGKIEFNGRKNDSSGSGNNQSHQSSNQNYQAAKQGAMNAQAPLNAPAQVPAQAPAPDIAPAMDDDIPF